MALEALVVDTTKLRDWLIDDMRAIREELVATVACIPDDQLDYMPGPGMKSYRSLLREVGGEEAEITSVLLRGELPANAQDQVAGSTPRGMLASLAAIRDRTLGFLTAADDEALRNPISLPEAWWPYLGMEIAPEELIRGAVRHEYYHLGQIIIYRWIQGHSPYS